MRPDSQPTLLLVHGAWHGAWYWEEKTAPWLRAQGLKVITMDLPGHGIPGPRKIGWYSINDYVDAVESKLNDIGGPVVVAGHSMGGYVAQKLMERRPKQLAGTILVAAASVQGVWGVVQQLVRHDPLNFLSAQAKLDLYHLVRTPALARDKFYRDDIPQDELTRYWSRISNESYRAFLDMLGLNPLRPQKADPALPKLVIGGGQDSIFPPAIVQATAKAYGLEAALFDDAPHSLNLDRGWQAVASHILDWMQQQFAANRSVAA